jgi:hypothetical protein
MGLLACFYVLEAGACYQAVLIVRELHDMFFYMTVYIALVDSR